MLDLLSLHITVKLILVIITYCQWYARLENPSHLPS